jgi:hypothetical protein
MSTDSTVLKKTRLQRYFRQKIIWLIEINLKHTKLTPLTKLTSQHQLPFPDFKIIFNNNL